MGTRGSPPFVPVLCHALLWVIRVFRASAVLVCRQAGFTRKGDVYEMLTALAEGQEKIKRGFLS